MLSEHIITATGLIALSLNVSGALRPSDRTLRMTSGWASAIWVLNNLLIGAQAAAALSALSVARQASASLLQDGRSRATLAAFGTLVAATIIVAVLTWNGASTLFPVAGSLTATYAMLYLRGASLRIALVLVNALWMVNAVVYDSGWQLAANLIAGSAAAVGAWRARQAQPTTSTSAPAPR